MYLVDYHTHSCCSMDSEAPLAEMVQAARKAGIEELCTTDHLDLQLEDATILKDWDWTPILKQYEETRRQFPDYRLLLGIELGGGHIDPPRAESLLAGIPLDFVIGSVHNTSPAEGNLDYYYMDFKDEAFARHVMDDYIQSLMALAPMDTYDALGHIIYPLRYINGKGGHHMTLAPWQEQVDWILRTVIESGRAIECNTHNGEEILPWIPVLERYRELGGELITIGSDAHRPSNVGKGLPEAAELLREKGYRWLTLYEKRKPRQIRL